MYESIIYLGSVDFVICYLKKKEREKREEREEKGKNGIHLYWLLSGSI